MPPSPPPPPTSCTTAQNPKALHSGFLDDPDDPSSVVNLISANELKDREEQVKGRMKRKMLALRRLFDGGAKEVIIADGRTEHPVRDALAGKGTIIQ